MLSRSTLRDLGNEAHRLAIELEAIDRRLAAIREILSAYDDASIDADPTRAEPKSLRNEMVSILQEVGHPLHYKELHQRLLARGIAVAGKDPAKNVGAQLSNDMRFEKVGGGRWALASQIRRNQPIETYHPPVLQSRPEHLEQLPQPPELTTPSQDDRVLPDEWDPFDLLIDPEDDKPFDADSTNEDDDEDEPELQTTVGGRSRSDVPF